MSERVVEIAGMAAERKKAVARDFYAHWIAVDLPKMFEGAMDKGLIGADALRPIAEALEAAAGQVRDLRRRLTLHIQGEEVKADG
jgi:hypothetical protein